MAVYARDWSGFDTNRITAPGGLAGFAGAPNGRSGTVHLSHAALHTHAGVAFLGKPYLFSGESYTGYVIQPLSNGTLLRFNEPIATNSFDPEMFLIQGPLGAVESSGISEVADRLYRISFPPHTENGSYHFTLLPTLLGAEGFPLDQNANGIPGEPDDAYTFTLILDTVPPRVAQHAPAGDVAGTVSSVDVWFSEAVDRATFGPSSTVISNQLGEVISVGSVQEVGLNRWRVRFPPQTATGLYTVNVRTNVTDLAGNPLTTDHCSLSTSSPLTSASPTSWSAPTTSGPATS